jgi:hypothetical protein
MERAVSKRLAWRAQIALSRRVSDWTNFGRHRIDASARLCNSAGVCVHVFCDGVGEFAEPFVLDFGRVEYTCTRAALASRATMIFACELRPGSSGWI